MTLRKWLRGWWEGEYIPPDNSPNSPVFRVLGRYRRHWSSRAAHKILEFYLAEWRWLLPFIVAVVGAFVAIKKL